MIKNYLTIAFRVFKNQLVYTLINVFGLGLGLACCLVTYVFLSHELSFDTFHEKKDQVFKVVTEYTTDQGEIAHLAKTSYPLAPAINRDLPDFGKVLQVQGPYENQISFTLDGDFKIFKESGTIYTNEHFFDLLSFEIIRGASGEILEQPGKAFLTETLAKKYFGDLDPIGQILSVQKDSAKVEVVGIVKDPPVNNSLPFDLLISYETFKNRYRSVHRDNWMMLWFGSTYVGFEGTYSLSEKEDRLNTILEKYIDKEEAAKYRFQLMPITEIHTRDEYGNNTNYTIPSIVIYVLIVLTVLLIGTACLNFINLATAQAINRAREIGIRKTIGGNRAELKVQFFLETLMIVLLAAMVALTITQVFLFSINTYLQQYTNYSLQLSFDSLLFMIPVILIVTLLAGFYPAFVISGYHPIEAIKSKITERSGSGNYYLRRVLVVAQFCFSIMMIVSMIIVASQMNYLNNSEMGFNRENVVHLNLPTNYDQDPSVASLKSELLNLSYVESAAMSFGPPIGGFSWNCSFRRLENDYEDGMISTVKFVDANYIDTWEISFSSGKQLTPREVNDSTFHVIVNKKFLKKLQVKEEEAVGFKFAFNGNLYGIIDAVTEDFNTHSLKVDLQPVIMAYRPDYFSGIDIRLKGKNIHQASGNIEDVFRKYYPLAYFDFVVPEDAIQDAYALEKFVYRIILIFSVMSVIISIIGLYGLVSFMVARNRKMIGVRKVFGASTWSILKIFAKEYLVLLGISFVIASPLAYLIGTNFLSSFVYRIPMNPMFFVQAFLIVLVIAVLTVGWKSYQSATQNPANSLRYE
ncbi:MAG: ABC transporter permease [bacterium]|nr:ABC transporter permease [bacterium]